MKLKEERSTRVTNVSLCTHLCTSSHLLAGHIPAGMNTGNSPHCSCRWNCKVLGTGNIHRDLRKSDVKIKFLVKRNNQLLSSLHILLHSFSFSFSTSNGNSQRDMKHWTIFTEAHTDLHCRSTYGPWTNTVSQSLTGLKKVHSILQINVLCFTIWRP